MLVQHTMFPWPCGDHGPGHGRECALLERYIDSLVEPYKYTSGFVTAKAVTT